MAQHHARTLLPQRSYRRFKLRNWRFKHAVRRAKASRGGKPHGESQPYPHAQQGYRKNLRSKHSRSPDPEWWSKRAAQNGGVARLRGGLKNGRLTTVAATLWRIASTVS